MYIPDKSKKSLDIWQAVEKVWSHLFTTEILIFYPKAKLL